jgi:hypothetical protein
MLHMFIHDMCNIHIKLVANEVVVFYCFYFVFCEVSPCRNRYNSEESLNIKSLSFSLVGIADDTRG